MANIENVSGLEIIETSCFDKIQKNIDVYPRLLEQSALQQSLHNAMCSVTTKRLSRGFQHPCCLSLSSGVLPSYQSLAQTLASLNFQQLNVLCPVVQDILRDTRMDQKAR